MSNPFGIPEHEYLKTQLHGSFLLFCQTFFPLVTSRKFEISNPTGRESHHKIISRALTKVSDCEINSLLINIQPGSGKSVLLSMWVAWMMSRFPDSNFLYIAFSHDLASKHTAFIKRVMENSHYRTIFGVDIRSDSKAKDHFSTVQGGIIRGFSSGGPVTGADGGFMTTEKRFTGAVICFPYDEVVHTEHGIMKIGDIVSKKLDVKVWSMNMHSRQYELKGIDGWHTNPGSDILKITLSDSSSVRCTPNHKIWTDNRGWVEAQDLEVSDSLPSWSDPICNSSPVGPPPYRVNSASTDPILFGQICSPFSILPSEAYIDGNHSVELCAGPALQNWESAMLLCVPDVLRFRTVREITNTIVSTVSVEMPNLNIFRLRTDKSPAYSLMNLNVFNLRLNAKRHTEITFSSIVYSLFENLFMDSVRLVFGSVWSLFSYHSSLASNSPKAGDTISAFKSGNRSPLFIDKIGHESKTYCISVKDNHNFVAGLCKGVLCHNCDDMTKPDDAYSPAMRENILRNYKETILQRPRGPHVPIICIAQRLHEDDICAYMMSGKDERKWDTVILPSLDGAGNALCPDVTTKEQLLEKREKNSYTYGAQYNQDPLPPGGALYKSHEFIILDEEPDILVTFLVADTAETSKSYNDASAFMFAGLYKLETGGLALHILDAWEIRVEPRDLESQFKSFYADCMLHRVKPKMAAIEKKSTGVTLLSILEGMRGLELREVKRTRASGSKTARFLEMQPIIASKLISFPSGAKHTELCVNHMIKITANDSHAHDDLADCMYDCIKIALIDQTLYTGDSDGRNKRVTQLMARDFNKKRLAIAGAR